MRPAVPPTVKFVRLVVMALQNHGEHEYVSQCASSLQDSHHITKPDRAVSDD